MDQPGKAANPAFLHTQAVLLVLDFFFLSVFGTYVVAIDIYVCLYLFCLYLYYLLGNYLVNISSNFVFWQSLEHKQVVSRVARYVGDYLLHPIV